MKKYLGTITILVKDRQNSAGEINKILSENSHLVIARLGVNVQRTCVENCTGLITVVVEGGGKEIGELTKKIDSFYGIVAKKAILSD